MLNNIAAAITNKHLLAFTYDGDNRLVEPHACGHTSANKAVMRAFQTGGDSGSKHVGWKLFSVDKIENFALLSMHFKEPRPGYSPNDKQIPNLLAQLDAN
jgi:hypothetical protein